MLVEEAERKGADLERAVQTLKSLEARLEGSRQGGIHDLISKIKARFDRGEKEKRQQAYMKTIRDSWEISSIQHNVPRLQAEVEEISLRIIELKKNFRLRRSLDGAKRILDEFHSKIENEWAAYKHERESRNVESVARQNKVFITHGLLDELDVVAKNNPEIKAVLDIETRLKIILGLQPALATGIAKKPGLYWGGIGVVLGGGEIMNTHPHTESRGLHKREAKGFDYDFSEITADIGMHIKHDQPAAITIDRPKVAGMVFQYKETQIPGLNERRLEKARELSAKYKLPLYIFKDGKVLADADNHEVDAVEIQDAAPQMGDKAYGKILESLCKEKPFAPGSDSEKALNAALEEYNLSTNKQNTNPESEAAA